MSNSSLDDAKRRLDDLLGQLEAPAPPDEQPEPPVMPLPLPAAPPQLTEALTRLAIGAALLGLDALGERARAWEQAAGLAPGVPAADGSGLEIPVRVAGEEQFRLGLIGWIFETEAELRPQGNPLQWSRRVVGHLFNSVFSVAFESLPRLGAPRRPAGEGGEQETARWVARGQLEEQRSRAFAAVAVDEIVNGTIVALAGQRGVQEAVAQLVRSPAMDDAIVTLAGREGVQRAVAELVRGPAIADAITYLVGTPALEEALDTLAHSPALVELVQQQGTNIAGEIAEEVRERGMAADAGAEALARRLLGRPPRAALPPEAKGMTVNERVKRRR
jgi:hypothetical protein